MSFPLSLSPYLVIAGPTAVGKTEVAVRVAAALGGEILSVDSRQVYRGMDIGTAKPSAAERAMVPHHLLDLVDPDHVYSAGRFAAQARDVVGRVGARGRVPVLVGGSGLYLGALLDGLFDGDAVPEDLRRQLETRRDRDGVAGLWEELGRLDPAAQQALSPHDEVRILRALELAMADRGTRARRWTRRPAPALGGPAVMVGLARSRDVLYRRIDARAAAMVETGWVDEVQGLLGRGFGRHDPGLNSLGYSEIAAVLLQGLPLPEAIERIQRRTRQYAKRQMTWFRRDRRLGWFDLDRLDTEAAAVRIAARYRAVAAGPAADGRADRAAGPVGAGCVDSES